MFDIFASHGLVFIIKERIIECRDQFGLSFGIGRPYPERLVATFFIETFDDCFVLAAEFGIDAALDGVADSFS